MSSRAAIFETLRADIDPLPVIDCHEHTTGQYSKYPDPIAALKQGYVNSDLLSAGGEKDMQLLDSPDVPLEKKWPVFERLWKRTEHTGYAHVTKWVLKNEYGIDSLDFQALAGMEGRLLDLTDSAAYEAYLRKHGIRCRLVNAWLDWTKFLAGELVLPPHDRLMIALPDYHNVRDFAGICQIAARTGGYVTTLDEYLQTCRRQFERFKELGAIGMKDQSAYGRGIAYENPSQAEAEHLFNRIAEDPRRSLGWPEVKPLDDFLFHSFMRMARDLELPVQIHTGHMAGIRNDIAKTNAVLLTPVLELHSQVDFDLFHGNWPYAGEWLYLGKNYPNAALDCCWLHIIDPRYSRRVLRDAVGAVPHSKIHGFGGDYGDCIEYAAGHLVIARDNIAAALADLVAEGWMSHDEARQVAADWLFNNPNEFFKLGMKGLRYFSVDPKGERDTSNDSTVIPDE